MATNFNDKHLFLYITINVQIMQISLMTVQGSPVDSFYRAAWKQTRSSDANSVCLSNACFVTKWKKDRTRFLYHTKDHLA